MNGLCHSTSIFEAFVRCRFKDDDFIFFRMKEDTELNRSCEDRVVITGLPSLALLTSTHAEKKKHYSEVMTCLIRLACVSADPQPKVLILSSLYSVHCR